MSIQLILWDVPYETRIIDKIRNSISTLLSDSEILICLKRAYDKWKKFPPGFMIIEDGDPGLIEHHKEGDEPDDDWFMSRVQDEVSKFKL